MKHVLEMMPERRWRMVAAVASLAAISAMDHAGVFGHQGPDRSRYDRIVARVAYAADGDTIDVDIPDRGRAVTRLRLRGIDCPEIAHAAGGQDAYFGQQAAAFVRENVVGRRVRIVLDPNHEPRGKYGRLLAYVYFVDTGEMLNETLIDRGVAYADRRFEHVLKHRFLRLEKKAAKAKVGLWAEVKPEQMPRWRQRMDAAQAR